MNRDLKAKWIAALRSGEYRQVHGELRSGSGGTERFCCLGVLCEVARVRRVVQEQYRFDDGTISGICLAGALLAAVGDDRQNQLMSLNDAPTAFADIADWIETHIPEDPA